MLSSKSRAFPGWWKSVFPHEELYTLPWMPSKEKTHSLLTSICRSRSMMISGMDESISRRAEQKESCLMRLPSSLQCAEADCCSDWSAKWVTNICRARMAPLWAAASLAIACDCITKEKEFWLESSSLLSRTQSNSTRSLNTSSLAAWPDMWISFS